MVSDISNEVEEGNDEKPLTAPGRSLEQPTGAPYGFGHIGLSNDHNLCFCNAALQLLLHNPDVVWGLINSFFPFDSKSAAGDGSSDTLTSAFGRFLFQFWHNSLHVLSPKSVVDAVNRRTDLFSGDVQQDSAEFYNKFIELLVDDLKSGECLQDIELQESSFSEKKAQFIWESYDKYYNNFLFSSLYGLRYTSTPSHTINYELFSSLIIPVPAVPTYVMVNVIENTRVKDSRFEVEYFYKGVVQQGYRCLVDCNQRCESIYAQMADYLNVSIDKLDLLLCCRGQYIRSFLLSRDDPQSLIFGKFLRNYYLVCIYKPMEGMRPLMIQFVRWRFVQEGESRVSRFLSIGFPRFLYYYRSLPLKNLVRQVELYLLPEYRRRFTDFQSRMVTVYSHIVKAVLANQQSKRTECDKQSERDEQNDHNEFSEKVESGKRQRLNESEQMKGSDDGVLSSVEWMWWTKESPYLPLFHVDYYRSLKEREAWIKYVFRKSHMNLHMSKFFPESKQLLRVGVLVHIDDGVNKVIQSTKEMDQIYNNIIDMMRIANPDPQYSLDPQQVPRDINDKEVSLDDCLRSVLLAKDGNPGALPKVKGISIYRLPCYLTFQLNRCYYKSGVESGDRKAHPANVSSNYYKVYTKVSYPLRNLDMKPFLCTESQEEWLYDLIGVCCHHGEMLNGHYYTFCKDNVDGKEQWWFYSDARVSKVEESEVMNKNAYMLVYQRKNHGTHTMQDILRLIQEKCS